MTIKEQLLHSAAGSQWLKVGVRYHHGIDVPLFSLHSETSCGIGEFPDLIPLIHWSKEIGLDVIQYLPLNDTGNDNSPYSAISANALHPIYLGLAQLPYLSSSMVNLSDDLIFLRKLNRSKFVNYKKVLERKTLFLEKYYEYARSHFEADPLYQKFLQAHSWLYPFALFKALKEKNGWRLWESWEVEERNLSQSSYQRLLQEHQTRVNFHLLMQYLCFQQMEEVRRVAEENGVFLKGDIPILISKESADVWWDRNLFLLDLVAGSPPDQYAKEGQNWNFPVYNWQILQESGYAWWKQRLRVAEHLYHIYRLDHIVGFFRIWAIPEGRTGKDGFFLSTNPQEWVPQGSQILQMMLHSCSLLPIGEDLGTVPAEVRQTLTDLGICGTKVMRWERHWKTDKSFISFDQYSPISMTTVSTHDTELLHLWWKSYPEEASAFAQFMGWPYEPELSKEQQLLVLRASHQTPSLFHINLLQEYLDLIPEMNWPGTDQERINTPGVVSIKNWSCRIRPTIEEIVSNQSLRKLFHAILNN